MEHPWTRPKVSATIERVASRLKARVAKGFGIVDGIDTYTGETLETIAKRASDAAKADAARAYADGTAANPETYASRVDDVKSAGKCWSVDEAREVMGTIRPTDAA